jgi:cell division protein FtsB
MAWLGFSDQGLIHVYRADIERQAYVERIRQLTEENQALLDEIERLSTDMKYVESVIRKQLALIKPNETIYRLNKKASQ